MKTARAVFKLHVICPHCGKQNGLRSLPAIEREYMLGSGDVPMTKRCVYCAREFGVYPVRRI